MLLLRDCTGGKKFEDADVVGTSDDSFSAVGGGSKNDRVSNRTTPISARQGRIADLKIPPNPTRGSNPSQPSF